MSPARKPILCLDFDGVVHSYSGWKDGSIADDPPVPGAVEFIFYALNSFRVCIHSSRSSSEGGIDAMKRWFARWCREEYYTKHAKPVMGEWWLDVEWPKYKPPAFLTIDDRAITFTGTWPSVPELLAFKPWWQEGQHPIIHERNR